MPTPPDFVPNTALTAAQLDKIGLWHVTTATAAGTSRSLLLDNVFTTDYSNYRLVGKFRSTVATNACFFQLVDTAGSTLATNYYNTAYGQDYAGGGTAFTVGTLTTVCYCGWIPNSTVAYLTFSFDILGPRIAGDATSWQGQHTGIASGLSYLGGHFVGARTIADANRGIKFDNGGAGNLTGSVSVYGYNTL